MKNRRSSLELENIRSDGLRMWGRVAAVTLCAILAGGLLYRNMDGRIAGQPVWLSAALLYGVAIGLTAILVMRYVPRLGRFVEFTAVSRLIFAGASLTYPDLAIAMTASPFLNASLVVGGATLLQVGLGPLGSLRFSRGLQRPGPRIFARET